ncbi:TRAP transporter small permease [[Bacteroides] pectinophilus]|jgi:TRAP-type C4-dicarboxylate transport system permease small subunit|nr:TRAP transporter small permease [[Bacteroides] pectinophilus]UWN95121.1 TRAP transporter small permease [[Bacteroides] pectinophilus]HBH92728.1 TRAP transporter small permease [Bacteroides sp.]
MKIKTVLTKALNGVAGMSFIVMVALTCWQVFTRYVLKNPSTWSEELVSYLFAWMSLLGASIVTSESGHMNIPVLVDRLNPQMRSYMRILHELIALLFSLAILVYGGWQISRLAMGQMTSSLGVPVGIFYFVMPLCGVLNIIYTIINIAEIAKNK